MAPTSWTLSRVSIVGSLRPMKWSIPCSRDQASHPSQNASLSCGMLDYESHADLEEIAEEEAEAVPWSRQAAPGAGMRAAPDRKEHSS